ncbi:glycosyltransferase [Candidatus Saccharibacteria bacterium]|nr:glycosyltransferase [Candidatus Saccharibacteria bacterium]
MNNQKPVRQTSQKLVTGGQIIFFGLLLLGVIVAGILWPLLAQLIVWGTILFFTVFVSLKIVLWYASTKYSFAQFEQPSMYDHDLPVYTIFVPLYKEVSVLPRLMSGLHALNYPKDKLQVLLLVEDETVDPGMHEAFQAYDLGRNAPFASLLQIPNVQPRGKQKALNIGLEHTQGKYAVIYDAEDIPEPNQLLKAVGRFGSADAIVGCLQARLFFDNEQSSWVSRLLWTEYVIHFEWILKGLAQLGLVPPLGGTSNHFRVDALHAIALDRSQLPMGAEGIGAWDPWNVTEDADLAGALTLHGYKIEMLDSVTYEIATRSVGDLLPQRSRWLKGYLQTGLVYLRSPLRTMKKMGPIRWFVYVLFLLGTPLSILLSTLSWILTIVYFSTRSEAIERLFPWPLLYLGTLLLVFGNFALFMQHVIAAHKREGHTTVKWLLLLPVWQQLATASLLIAIRELLQPSKRSTWRKTTHEHDLEATSVSSYHEATTVEFPVIQPAQQERRVAEPDPV